MCLQPAAFLSRLVCITPSTYVFISFVRNLVLAKSVVVSKVSRQTFLFDRLLYQVYRYTGYAEAATMV